MTNGNKEDEANNQTGVVTAFADVPEIYMNGFSVGFSNSDIFVEIQRNGRKVQILNMSFTIAKTLSQLLGNTVQQIEAAGKFDIRTTKELDAVLHAAINPENKPK